MARSYHIDIVTFASGAPAKWVDNLFSHFDVGGTERRKQGIARRITADGIYHVVLIWRLSQDLSVRNADAVAIAAKLLAGDGGPIVVAPGLELCLDRDVFQRDVDRLIELGVEAIVPARRGRPRTLA